MHGFAISWALVKAFVMASAVAALANSEPFWHQLVLVMISATTTLISVVISALLTTKRIQDKLEEPLADLHTHAGLTKRATDNDQSKP